MARLRPRGLAPSVVACLFLIPGCDGDGTGPDPDPTIAITASPATLSVEQGDAGTTTVSVVRGGGFTGSVTVAASGLPSGVSAPTVTIGAGSTTAVVTFTAGADAAPGVANVTLTGTGTGVQSASTTVEVEVTEAPTGGFELAMDPDAVRIDQAATSPPPDRAVQPTASSTVIITRQAPFQGPVELSVTAAPDDLETTLAETTVAGAGTTLTVEAMPGLAPGTYTVTVTGTGDGVPEGTATLEVTVAAAGDFTLSLDPASLSVAQGATAQSTVRLTREAPFDGSVDLAVSGAPTGLEATLAETSVEGETTTLTVEAAAGLAPGSYTLTVTGTAAGLPDRSADLEVTVSPVGGGEFSVEICDARWFAVKDGDGAWVRVTGTDDRFTFDVTSDAVGVAWVQITPGEFGLGDRVNVEITLMGREEVSLFQDPCQAVADGKTVTGTVSGFDGADLATVELGYVSAVVTPDVPTFTLENVPDGPLDLFVTRSVQDEATGSMDADRMILRRAQNLPDGTHLSLNFDGAGAFDLVDATVALSGLGGGDALFAATFQTEGTFFGAGLATHVDPQSPVTVPAVPGDRRQSGDLHSLLLSAAGRGVYEFHADPAGETVELGPPLDPVTVTSTTTADGVFPSAAFTSQAEYGDWWNVTFSQTSELGGGVDVDVFATEAYGDGAPAELAVPDFSTVGGWDTGWNLAPSREISWDAVAANGLLEFVFPTDGTIVLFGTAEGAIDP